MPKSQLRFPCWHTCTLLFRPFGFDGFSTTHSAAQSVAGFPPPGTQVEKGGVALHCPVPGSQAATWSHGVSAPHTTGTPKHTPAPHASWVVHRLPSSQGVPSGAAVCVQEAVASHASTVPGLPSSRQG